MQLTFYYGIEFIAMAAIRRLWHKHKKSGRDNDDWQNEHKRIFLPVLDAFIEKVKRQSQRHELHAPSKDLVFLNDVGFFEDLKNCCPSVEVSRDISNAKLYLKGRGEEFVTACQKCSWTLQQICTKVFILPDPICWDLLAENHVREQVNNIITAKSIKAQVC